MPQENRSPAGIVLPEVTLTRREQEVLLHLSAGRTYASAARRMNISRHTVDAHVRRIKQKFGVTSWMEIIGTFLPRSEGRSDGVS